MACSALGRPSAWQASKATFLMLGIYLWSSFAFDAGAMTVGTNCLGVDVLQRAPRFNRDDRAVSVDKGEGTA